MSLVVDIEKRLGSFPLRSEFETGSGTMALLGASGCGKSVTLKCIAGIMTPDKGRIDLDGETLFDSEKQHRPDAAAPAGGLSLPAVCPVSQYDGPAEYPAVESVRQPGSRAGTGLRAAASLSLEGLEKKYPAQLSGGQQQRVALARILASEPGRSCWMSPFPRWTGF